ncbi:large subunit ribosomal protein LP1 [Setomelanomma holmii]|uniref:Large ribosomal subunit protein P1 n=1 Tax=Setomelanomma holmii TaxID=210430 RepID=A0A9P4GV16_9PLEO|nr:large subunit ribosomal protein LP1 [Setomelanomma holmii]
MSTNKAEQAVAYAALILADESIAITPEKLQTLLKAAGIEDVEPTWTMLFAKALEGRDVKDILTKVAASGPAVGEAPVSTHDRVCDAVADDGDKGDDGGKDDGSDDDSDIGMSLFD